MPEWDVYSYNAILSLYAQTGHIDRAKALFDGLWIKDSITWSTMVAAYAQDGGSHTNLAMELFRLMVLDGFSPHGLCFVSLLAASSHLGLKHETRESFASMVSDFGVDPSPEHFLCVIDALGRSGELGRSRELIESMPFVPDEGAWSTLLAACSRGHGSSVEELAAHKTLELDPRSSPTYVLLSSALCCQV
ncbi:hypothetical protein SELMODRAFT_79856 [Selaginella moellendorffii]|uniref:Pentacotripeptide-repeat region of PRORP domain-containing protein n=2 Tax=Selaginella moellendorffii TaxID=88036 RepID=D8QXT2_SELML|nr:hypothetical protein SELMODRAFT_79856 [Selaginella moellendorffii]